MPINTRKGFAMLYMMLLVASVLGAAALAAGVSGTFSGNRMRGYEAGAKVRMVAMQCAETLLMQVRATPVTVSSGTLAVQDGSCTYSISGTVPTKTITLAATRGTLYKRITIATSQVSPVILSTWTETAN